MKSNYLKYPKTDSKVVDEGLDQHFANGTIDVRTTTLTISLVSLNPSKVFLKISIDSWANVMKSSIYSCLA